MGLIVGFPEAVAQVPPDSALVVPLLLVAPVELRFRHVHSEVAHLEVHQVPARERLADVRFSLVSRTPHFLLLHLHVVVVASLAC